MSIVPSVFLRGRCGCHACTSCPLTYVPVLVVDARMASGGPPPRVPKNLGSYYRRPSAAIERGGGFFVPGLQGFRLRLVFSGVILGLLVLNGVPRPGFTNTQLVSETMAAMAALALLVQAFLDQRMERAVQMRREALAAGSSRVSAGFEIEGADDDREVSYLDEASLGEELGGRTSWAADILLQLTPACSFVTFSATKVLARVGATGGEADDPDALAVASRRAGQAPRGSAITVTRGTDIDKDATDGTAGGLSATQPLKDNAVMSLLPSACQQGILCSTPVVPGLSGGSVAPDEAFTTVLIGSKLRGTGAFTERDITWFQRVCARLHIPELASEAPDTR